MCAHNVWGEVRDVAEHPIMYTAALSPPKHHPAPNVSSNEVGISMQKLGTQAWQIPGRPSRQRNQPERPLLC